MNQHPIRLHSKLLFGLALPIAFALTGCHSRFVQATVDNQTPSTLHLIEIDYPSASFGLGNLAAHGQFHYRFKIQGSGTVKLQFTDDQGQLHTSEGPEIKEGQEGGLTVLISPAAKVTWQPQLSTPQ